MTYWSENIRHSLRPLKHICHINPSVLPETTDPDWEFDYIDIGSVKLSEGVKHKERVRFEASPSRARKPVSPFEHEGLGEVCPTPNHSALMRHELSLGG